ncbi:primosomal protein N' [Thalassobaculum sp.]|uniref:primosomal protein N' n=1 Tax=Thalassobaculum sp. TaxID=2022740 RepID=UPI003B5B9F20
MTDLLPLDDPFDRVSVLLPLPLDVAYDYKADPALELARGDVVEVPLGQRRMVGVVLGPGTDESVAAERLRGVFRRFEVPRLPKSVIDLVEWTAAWTLAPRGNVVRMAISTPSAFEPPAPVVVHTAGAQENWTGQARLTPARRRVLSVLSDGPALEQKDLAREAGVGPSVIKGMIECGMVQPHTVAQRPPFEAPDPTRTGPTLSGEQREAADTLCAKVRAHAFSVTAVDGITGSGKTEVYFEAIAAALAAGKQALVLLPEIALSAEWLERFADRFGVEPAVWHSDLKPKVRRETWRAVAEGSVRVLVGARSALFLPFAELGLIVIDEEHESAYKQEDGVAYHARDMAVVRARLEGIPIALVSATPSLETVENVRQGRYGAVHLTARPGSATLPEVKLIDLRKHAPERGTFLSPPLVEAVQRTLAEGEQSMLFLNRRGYAPLTLCRSCGHRLECPNCTAWLVEHRLLGRLVCHHCGLSARLPKHCPSCEAEDSFVASGPGVERLAEEVLVRFPDARFQLASSDTLTGPDKAAEFVRSVRAREVDIIIGTQVVAKGHNFPWLTLVGVVDADLGLAGGDLRASERTYQLLHQVSGRAGRAERPGTVLLQTHAPETPVMQALAAGDREAFLQSEIDQRKASGMPPYGRLAGLVISAPDADRADAAARTVARAAPRLNGVTILGPAPAPITMLRGRHRRRLLVKAGRQVNIQQVLRDWLAPIKLEASVRLQVDVDPYSFM